MRHRRLKGWDNSVFIYCKVEVILGLLLSDLPGCHDLKVLLIIVCTESVMISTEKARRGRW